MRHIGTTLLLLPVLSPIAAAQTIHYVDDDAAPNGNGLSWDSAYDTLQAGLGVLPGDKVWVAAGTYVGNFTLTPGVEVYGGFDGTETQLNQRDWQANETILDGNQIGSVIVAPTGLTGTTRLDGFTITNGTGTVVGDETRGGGVYLFFSSPRIENSRITRNSADVGGGVYTSFGSPTVMNNTIERNTAGVGGGLYALSGSPEVMGNTITNNGHAGTAGGGIALESSSATIAENTIANNRASGLNATSSTPEIVGNSFRSNSGGGCRFVESGGIIANNAFLGNGGNLGGALFVKDASPTITGNTIIGNASHPYYGGGLHLDNAFPSITNTVIAFNSSGISLWPVDTLTFRNNCVFGNEHFDYFGLADLTGTDGNISADPQFVDARFGNSHVQPESPCVDAGNNADAWGDVDIDGDPRVWPGGGTVDIGADESVAAAREEGPYAIIHVSADGDDANDGASWGTAKASVQAGVDAASLAGGEVWISAGRYRENIWLHAYAYVFGGFSGDETRRQERNWEENVTFLDGDYQDSVVTAWAGHHVSAIDGFRIVKGIAREYYWVGGGLFVQHASPRIAHNWIYGNSAESQGGAVFLGASSAILADNRITTSYALERGGGVYMQYSSPTLVRNVIANCSSAGGGGLFAWHSSPRIVRCTIANNSADGNGGGLVLSEREEVFDSGPLIANSTIVGNRAGADGGGIALGYCDARITNSTIAANNAGSHGGAVYSIGWLSTSNTIVAFNSSGLYDFYTLPTLRHNCFYGNAWYDYGGGVTDPTGTDGNVSVDPLFLVAPDPGPDGDWGTDDDYYGDLHLSLDSPIIDAGDNAEVPADVLDLDGDGDLDEPVPFDLDGFDRFMDDPLTPDTGAGTAPIVDIGAYEFGPDDCRHGGGLDHDGDVDLLNYAALTRCVMGPDVEASAGCACFDVDDTGFVDLADVAVFQTSFTGE